MDSRTPRKLLIHTILWAITAPILAVCMLMGAYEAIQTGRVLSKHSSCTSGSFCYLTGVIFFIAATVGFTWIFIFMLSRLIKNESTKIDYGSTFKDGFLSEGMVTRSWLTVCLITVVAICYGAVQLYDLVF